MACGERVPEKTFWADLNDCEGLRHGVPSISIQESASSTFSGSSSKSTKVSQKLTPKMPRVGSRRQFIDNFPHSSGGSFLRYLNGRLQSASAEKLMWMAMAESDDSDFENQFEISDLSQQRVRTSRNRIRRKVRYLQTKRYSVHRVYCPGDCKWLQETLPSCDDTAFRFHTRMDRRSFGVVLQVLNSNCTHIFSNRSNSPQLPISSQLHIALFTLGFYGNGAAFSAAAHKYDLSVGMVANARKRVCRALYEVMDKFIKWPNESERQQLCKIAEASHGYKRCFFAVDGTTHPLFEAPGLQKECFFDRKKRYSLHALVTNDFNLRVINLLVGFPGSTHDARVMEQTFYHRNMDSAAFFTGKQHGLGDAAFRCTRRVVPTYKSPHTNLPENVAYNYRHSSIRIKSEHTIGVVKERFQGLKEVRINIKDIPSYEHARNYLCSAYVLHNILLTEGDELYTPVGGSAVTCGTSSDHTSVELEEDLDQEGKAFREEVKQQVLQFFGYD